MTGFLVGPAQGANTTWGNITGSLSNQADLNTALSQKENTANKSTNTALGTSDLFYPSQNAVRVYANNIVNAYSINVRTGNYTLIENDAGRLIQVNSVNSSTITIPSDSSINFPVGTHVTIANTSTGLVSIVGGSGVAVSTASGVPNTLMRNQLGRIIKIAANNWVFSPFFFNSSPLYSFTALLLHFEGSSIVDSSPQNIGISDRGCTIATAQKKFGNSSVYLDQDFFTLSSDTSLSMGDGDFSVEGWVQQTYHMTYNKQIFSATGISISTDNNSRFQMVVAGNTVTNTFANSLNTWYHFCASRYDGSLRFFIDGGLVGTLANNTTSISFANARFGGSSSNNTHWIGYFDECRILRVGAYQDNFTPQSSAFSDY